jgi:TP901 family phage tail tape measure protein
MSDERTANVELTATTTQYNAEIAKSQSVTDKLVTSLDKMAKSVDGITKRAGKGMIKVGAGELAALGALSTIAGTLERQTSNIQANLAINKTSGQFDQVTKSIRDMSRAIPMARAEIAGMATEVSNLGFVSGDQISKVSLQFSKMGIATGESPAALAQNMVQFERAMGITPSAATMDPLSNSATYLSAKAGVPANDILSFASNIAPAARVAGLNPTTVMGISTAANRSGADGAYASSTIQQILNDITALRYTKSPEMKRYSSALGMDLGELMGPVQDSDKFNRNIINKILQASQSEEGPTKLSLLGFDGLRAKRALQTMATEGGVEQWTRQAEYGTTQPAIETGFKASADGMFDQTEMLKNKFTDLGQVIGTPVMKEFTALLKIVNSTVGVFGKLVEPVSTIAGYLAGPFSAALMAIGGLYTTWKLASNTSLLTRAGGSMPVNAFQVGKTAGRSLASHPDAKGDAADRLLDETMAGKPRGYQQTYQRLKDGEARPLQPFWYKLGAAYGAMTPEGEGRGPVGKTRSLADRFGQWMNRETGWWYSQSKMYDVDETGKPIRVSTEDRKRRREEWDKEREEYKKAKKAATEAGEEFKPNRKYEYVPSDSWRGLGRTYGETLLRNPVRANGYLLNGMGGAIGQYGGKAVSSAVGGISSMGAAMFGNPWALAGTAGLAAGGFALNNWWKQRQEDNRWKEGGKGFNGEVVDNMAKYNEVLGIATRNLSRFSSAVEDATKPAKTEDVKAALLDEDNTYRAGRQSNYKMVNEDIRQLDGNPQAIKEWLAAQGPMNSQQATTVFRDIAQVTPNKADYTKIRDWYVGNSDQGQMGPTAYTGQKAITDELLEKTSKERSLWQRFLSNVGYDDTKGSVAFEGALQDPEAQQASSNVVANITSLGSDYGNSREAESLVSTGTESEKQYALKTTVSVGQLASTLQDLAKQYSEATTSAEKVNTYTAWKNVRNRGGEALGMDLSGLDIKGNASADENQKKVWEAMWSEIQKGVAKGDSDLTLAVNNNLLNQDQKYKGVSLEEFMKSLPMAGTTTSTENMLKSSDFANMGQEDKDKYFGKGVLKDWDKGITDPTKRMAASMALLQMAQDKYGGSVAETDNALQSLKNGLSETDQKFQDISNAQMMLQQSQVQYIQFGSRETRQADLQQRVNYNIEAANEPIPAADTASRLQDNYNEVSGNIVDMFSKAREYEKSAARQARDFNISMAQQEEDYQTSRAYMVEDSDRSIRLSKESFYRQMANSEAAYHRQLKYSQADFNRSREREEAAHARQMKYAAQDLAKSAAQPYQRTELQTVFDPDALRQNMKDKTDLMAAQNEALKKLSKGGLSDQAINQYDLANPNNAQEAIHLANVSTKDQVRSQYQAL